jgi:hypothetical protein
MLIWQNVPGENGVVGREFVDAELLNGEIYRKMRVNGGS